MVSEAEQSRSSERRGPAPGGDRRAGHPDDYGRSGERDSGGAGRGGGRGRLRGARRKRKRACAFCVDRRAHIIDYKNVRMLRDYLDERARIKKARQTGTCRKHQRKVARAIKRAREVALVQYTID